MTKHVVITGASSGIGAALARQLAARGHRVALAARREAELNEVATRAGANAIAIPTDVTKRSDVNQLRDKAIDAFGHLDVWINNAGRGITRAVMDLSDDELDGRMRTRMTQPSDARLKPSRYLVFVTRSCRSVSRGHSWSCHSSDEHRGIW